MWPAFPGAVATSGLAEAYLFRKSVHSVRSHTPYPPHSLHDLNICSITFKDTRRGGGREGGREGGPPHHKKYAVTESV